MSTAIRIRHVSHRFGEEGDARQVQALLGTSLDIVRGELICLIGPSGCGKSTLLNIMGGLMMPAAGHVEVLSRRVTGPMPRTIPVKVAVPPYATGPAGGVSESQPTVNQLERNSSAVRTAEPVSLASPFVAVAST